MHLAISTFLFLSLLVNVSLSWAYDDNGTNKSNHHPSYLLETHDQLIIVMDDIGHNRSLGEQALNLPSEVALAFLPHAPFSRKLAIKANEQQHDILLHQPMENESGYALGKGALTSDMDVKSLVNTLLTSLDSIPFVTGINNHMGSLLTQNSDAMSVLLETIKSQDLFFIDSVTSAQTVAWKLSETLNIPTLRRHVFLDNDVRTEALQKQWQTAIKHAKDHGLAVLIAHPYPETLAFLPDAIKGLNTRNIQLISPSEHFNNTMWGEFKSTPFKQGLPYSVHASDLQNSRYSLPNDRNLSSKSRDNEDDIIRKKPVELAKNDN